jgi:hypothetical protein
MLRSALPPKSREPNCPLKCCDRARVRKELTPHDGEGRLGTVAAVRNAPDGYTLVIVHIGTMTLNPHVCANPAYDPLTDIAPIDEPPSDFTVRRLD